MKGDYVMYSVRVRIGDVKSEHDTSVDFASLYRAARSLVKYGKHYGARSSVVISDYHTGKTIVRLYSLNSYSRGEWVAAQSAVGKYHKHIDF